MLYEDENFHHIKISYEEMMIHITTNSALLNYLALLGNRSLQLADHILADYETLFHKPLAIHRYSLAIEILAHAYIDSFSKILISLGTAHKLPIFKQALNELKKIQSKTEIIDCGERSIDNNRYIWDALVPYHTAIFMLCGQRS